MVMRESTRVYQRPPNPDVFYSTVLSDKVAATSRVIYVGPVEGRVSCEATSIMVRDQLLLTLHAILDYKAEVRLVFTLVPLKDPHLHGDYVVS